MRKHGRSRGRELVLNLGLSALSVTLFLAFCELVVFRWILPASDVPVNAYVDDCIRYRPDQQGIWRVRDEIAAPYAINAQGWNSGIGDYAVARRPGVARIAVIGDSFVEALQVPHDRSLAERLAADLGAAAGRSEIGGQSRERPVEAYRFGISGAPMSQYLQMAEHAVAPYRPDWLVVLIVHNDFDESYKFKPGRYTSSFLKLRVADGRVIGEIPPVPWRSGALDRLRQTATARFFVYRWQIRPQMLLDLVMPPAQAAPRLAANVDIDAILADRPGIDAVTDYLFGRLDGAAHAMGARLLLAMDGDRSAIYRGTDSPALALNRLAARMAGEHHIPFVDLEPVFAADWRRQHRRFDFAADDHWNEHGHAVAAEAIAAGLQAQGFDVTSLP